ncbi:hypothetical protein [Patulibacter defluvii]|uniref:hypothetical protein n=1 Tax=Patulibacter defluvii TaxID=3095358 RepID=UPI002A763721|nr:hypothetical protein [Patulibacter sp. DM4]
MRTWEWLEADLPTLIEPLVDVQTYGQRFAELAPDLARHAAGGAGARPWWQVSTALDDLCRVLAAARETVVDCGAAIQRLATTNRRARIRLGLEVDDLRDDRHRPSVVDYAVIAASAAATAGRLSDANLTIASAAPAAIREGRIAGVSLCPAWVPLGETSLVVSENIEIAHGICGVCDNAMDDARRGVEEHAAAVAELPGDGRELSVLAAARAHVDAVDRQIAFASRVLRAVDDTWASEQRRLLRWFDGPEALGGPEVADHLRRTGEHWACHAVDAMALVRGYSRTARHEPTDWSGDPGLRFDDRDWSRLLR